MSGQVRPGSTPTTHANRRREDYDADSPNVLAQAPWTAARCNRLLRPISSKIAALRKAKRDELTRQNAGFLAAPTGRGSCPLGHSADAHAPVSCVDDRDAQWDLSPRPRKKIKRTYSSKIKPQVPIPELVSSKSTKDNIYNNGMLRPLHNLVPVGSITAQATNSSQGVWEGRDHSQNEQKAFTQGQCGLEIRSINTSRAARDSSRRIIQQLARREGKDYWKLYDGIQASFEALLKATHSEALAKSEGCRSLFSTCLRNVPQYIIEEEHWSKIDDPDCNRDVTTQVYTELENSAIADGWKPLREAVRAHGVEMMGSAIADNLIGMDMADEMVSFCVSRGAHKEAQYLIESMIAALGPLDSTNGAPTASIGYQTLIINTLQSFARKTGKYSFLFRKMAALAISDVFSTRWESGLLLKDCWDRMIQSIIWEDDHFGEASALLRTIIRKAYQSASFELSVSVHEVRRRAACSRPGLRSTKSSHATESLGDNSNRSSNLACADVAGPQNGGTNPFAEFLTVLLASDLIRNQGSLNENNAHEGALDILQTMALEALQALELSSLSVGFGQAYSLRLEQLSLPLLTFAMLSTRKGRADEDILDLQSISLETLASSPGAKNIADKAGIFLCGAARCCGKATSSDAFDFARHIVQQLVDLSSSPVVTKLGKDFYSSMAVTAAFAFSQDTSLPTHLDWALSVEHAVSPSNEASLESNIQRTPARVLKGATGGYRWEDGICEWIAKTPALLMDKKSGSESSTSTEDRITMQIVAPGSEPPPVEVSPCIKIKTRDVSEGLSKGSGQSYLKCVKLIIATQRQAQPSEKLCEKKRTDVTCQSPHKNQITDRQLSPDCLLDLPDRLSMRERLIPQTHRGEFAKQKTSSVQLGHRSSRVLQIGEPWRMEVGKENWDIEDELSFG